MSDSLAIERAISMLLSGPMCRWIIRPCMSRTESRASKPWPAYSLASVREHIHAIGILSANFNGLENQLLGLLKIYDGAPADVVSFLFEKVPTETRLEWLRRLVKTRLAQQPKLAACIHAFAAAYKACTDNRNLIVHSRINAYFSPDDALMLSKRVRSHGEEQHLDLSLEVIRRVADEVHDWNRFGSHVLAFVLRRQRAARHAKYRRQGMRLVGPTTLPEIFPPPANLATPSQNEHETPARPPVSSRRIRKAERKKLWKKPKEGGA